MKTLLKISILLVALIFISCDNTSSKTNSNSKAEVTEKKAPAVLKLYLNSKAEIINDGTSINYEELTGLLKSLRENKGTVYYSRANINSKAPEESMSLVNEIIKYQLPVKFFTDSTFTKSVEF